MQAHLPASPRRRRAEYETGAASTFAAAAEYHSPSMHTEITIRPLATQADFAACVALQRDTWGREFNDAVPGSILLVSQRLGGVAAGAFDADGRLVGFVFGITGVENGSVVHWSDMLAVRPEAQNLGVGRRLKEFQRQAVARVGGRVIYWTYDPLVARNAHLNFNVFGVRAVEYARDMYGHETGSDLHRGIGTDRLVVAWAVDSAELAQRKRETSAARDAHEYRIAPVIGDADHPDHRWDSSIGTSQHLRLAVPLDVSIFQSNDPARAANWRASTRAAFESALGARYRVDGFNVDAEQDRGFYLLAK
jgi:predicted GNAT superfamily acetyltransferase